jgi:hypothetical protein
LQIFQGLNSINRGKNQYKNEGEVSEWIHKPCVLSLISTNLNERQRTLVLTWKTMKFQQASKFDQVVKLKHVYNKVTATDVLKSSNLQMAQGLNVISQYI